MLFFASLEFVMHSAASLTQNFDFYVLLHKYTTNYFFFYICVLYIMHNCSTEQQFEQVANCRKML